MSTHIRWRIAIPYVLLIFVTLSGVGFYLSNFVRQIYLDNLQEKLLGEARLASENLAPKFYSTPDSNELDLIAKQWASLLGSRVTIISADGTVLGESQENRAQMDNHLNRPEIIAALSHGQGSSTRFSQTVKYPMQYTAVTINVKNQVVGFVRLALPLQQIDENVIALQRTLVSVTVVAILLAIFLGTWIAGRTTRSLSELTQTAALLAKGDLNHRIIPTTHDEVGQLTEAFNEMASQLRSRIEESEVERSQMAAVLSKMTDGVLIVDSNGRVQLINPAAENMFGVHQEEILNHSLAEALRHYQVFELWQRCHESGESQNANLELSAKRLILQGVATPLGQALPGSMMLLFQNLTQLRRLETVRRDFISNISHELRTPLASLKALTETLQEGALDDPPAARRFLQRIETEVDKLSLMVSELLELSRIESGRVPLIQKPTSPIDIILPAVERLRLQGERAGLTITVDCPSDLPFVLADSVRMEQVLVNLLHNAIKFTPAGGSISVKAQLNDNTILFSVQDTGIGIPAKDLPRIFERFYKADRARSSGGTGLGLAIARHLVEAHHGEIWADSIEGKGSTFYFSIPITDH
jgi:two-component system, OmpR family, phosphate regulon sensor histidine kinase PhoR